jgi:hypothetical protein
MCCIGRPPSICIISSLPDKAQYDTSAAGVMSPLTQQDLQDVHFASDRCINLRGQQSTRTAAATAAQQQQWCNNRRQQTNGNAVRYW